MSTYPLTASGHTSILGGKWAATGGSSPAVLADASDATFIANRPGQSVQILDLTTATVPAGEVILAVVGSVRAKANLSGCSLVANLATTVSGRLLRNPDVTFPLTTAWKTFALPTYGRRPGDAPWTQAAVDAAAIWARGASRGATPPTISIALVGALLKTTSVPTVTVQDIPAQNTTRPWVRWDFDDRTVATPTQKALTSNVATITTAAAHGYTVGQTVTVAIGDAVFDGQWTITAVTSTTFSYAVTNSNITATAASGQVWIGDSKPQATWRVRVFTSAQYSIAGFSPATSPATWDSGVRSNADDVTQVTTDLRPGTYRAYLQCTAVAAGQTIATNWANDQFTVDFTDPAAPHVAAVWNPATQAVDCTVLGFGNLLGFEQASSENTASGWNAANATAARDSGGVDGSWHLKLTASSAAEMSISTSDTKAVTPGVAYQFWLWYQPSVQRTCYAEIEWFDQSYAAISTTTSAPFTGAAGGWRGPAAVIGTAPPSAQYARLRWRVTGSAAGEVHRVDALQFTPTASGKPTQFSPGGFSGWRILLQRSTDGGATWTQVRAPGADQDTDLGVALTAGDPQVLAVTDHEAPRHATVWYRASEHADVPQMMQSLTSAPVAVATGGDDTWWLKCLANATLNRGGVQVIRTPKQTISEQTAVFWPLGRSRPVVVAGEIGGEDGAATIIAGSASAAADLTDLLTHQGVLLLQSPFTGADGVGKQWWVRLVGDRPATLDGTPAAPRATADVTWIDVGPPAVGV